MEQRLIAVGQRGPNDLPLYRLIPAGGGGDGAGVGGEPHEHGLVAELLAHQLTQVEFARSAHLGGSRVAQVRVVGPDHHLGLPALRLKEAEQRVEGVGHVLVAQVPGTGAAPEHGAVVLLGAAHDLGVLLGEEEFIGLEPAVALA